MGAVVRDYHKSSNREIVCPTGRVALVVNVYVWLVAIAIIAVKLHARKEHMQVGRIVDIFLAIVTVAGAMVIVTSKYTAQIIKAFGDAFTGGLKTATGH